MKNKFDILSPSEKEKLLKFPAYIALLAANWDGKIDETEKKKAINFSHVKTYSSDDPVLKKFFTEADKVFEKNFEELDEQLPKEKEARDKAIDAEIAKLEPIVLKLGREYAVKMHDAIKGFKEHVSKAHHGLLESFILPLSIKGLNT